MESRPLSHKGLMAHGDMLILTTIPLAVGANKARPYTANIFFDVA